MSPLRPRRLSVAFTEPPLPLHWNRSAVETHLVNALNLLLPYGERFFIRAARAALAQVKNPSLTAQVKGFIAQEAHHAHQHERSFEALDAQGLPATTLADRLERLNEKYIERRLSLPLRISVIAAVEHFTALLAEYAFTSEIIKDADPRMRQLFLWHCAEEIEHKCVAFDLLNEVDSRYTTRAIGMLLAFSLLLAFWYGTAFVLLRADPSVRPLAAARDWLWAARNRRIPLMAMFRGALDYMRPGFHPSQHDNFFRVEEYFGSAEGAAGAMGAVAGAK